MKKLYFIFIIFIFCGISVFGDNDIQEEVDFLLFLPNSSNQFVNEEQALIQLDNLARYLLNKNLVPGQIIVYGYAAFAPNEIESFDLSRERALFVINELQKRGVSKNLFSDPVGYGSVYLWGDNAVENDRKPNRRVRILLGGGSPAPINREINNAEIKTVFSDSVHEKPFTNERMLKKSNFKFPWWLFLLLAAFLLLLFLLLPIIKRSQKTVNEDVTENTPPYIPETDTLLEPSPAASTFTVNLDEKIRLRAYELSQKRNEQGDYRDHDWHNAVCEISALYTDRGYSVFSDGRSWWALRSYNR